MHHMWEKLAFQSGDGDLPHEADQWAGHCKGQAFTPELQEVPQRADGDAKCGIRGDQRPYGEPDGENQN